MAEKKQTNKTTDTGLFGLNLIGQFSQLQGSQKMAKAHQASAREIMRTAQKNVEIVKKQAENMKGQQRVLFSKSGVDLSGSPMKVIQQTQDEFSDKASEIMRTAQAQAAAARKRAKKARLGGALGFVKGIANAATGGFGGSLMDLIDGE